MYTVKCRKCGGEYQSGSNRSGVCPDCRKTRSQISTKYRDKTYDSLTVYVPKGEREKLKEFAKEHNMSLNEFVNRGIDMIIEKILSDEKEK